MDYSELVKSTWAEIGCRVRPLRRMVFVRTDLPKQHSDGGIWYPSTESGFYDGPFHLRLVTATVLAAGSKSILKPAERVCFQRKYFARWCVLEDRTMIGWLDETEITGIMDDGVSVGKFVENPLGPKQPMALPL